MTHTLPSSVVQFVRHHFQVHEILFTPHHNSYLVNIEFIKSDAKGVIIKVGTQIYDHLPPELKTKTTRQKAMLVSVLHELGHLQARDSGLDDANEVLAWLLARRILKAHLDVFEQIPSDEWDLYVDDGLAYYEALLGSDVILRWAEDSKEALKSL
jgi:hypothetical protein